MNVNQYEIKWIKNYWMNTWSQEQQDQNINGLDSRFTVRCRVWSSKQLTENANGTGE